MAEQIVRILSIDGGGIRGIIPAIVIQELERRTGRAMRDVFHMIAGTSTGGLLACGLARPSAPMSGAELEDLYVDNGHKIFARSLWDGVRSLGGTTDERYSADGLEEVLEKTLRGDVLSAVSGVELLIPSYAIELPEGVANTASFHASRVPYFFKSWAARGRELKPGEDKRDRDFLLRSIARATSAAPTYFEPALVSSASGKCYAMIDGGVFANNPAMCALAAARRLYPEAGRFLVVSLGTGGLQRPIPYSKAKDWGLIGWLRPLISVIFDASSDTVCYQLDEEVGEENNFRFDIALGERASDPEAVNDDFDDASPGNISNLQAKGRRLVDREAQDLDRLAALLVQPRWAPSAGPLIA